TADMITAAEALQLGLVNAVVPADQLIPKCKEILAKCYTKSSLALAKTIDAVNAALQPHRNGFEVEAVEFGRVCVSADGREGTKAFLEKRKPIFTGK
ncbi:MAG: enoyl-CoA hydratase-related protein, partial [Bacteroidia bacterium]|nr:enoyl-CoA hydratase-related protein [Bacteroidia bacterium]